MSRQAWTRSVAHTTRFAAAAFAVVGFTASATAQSAFYDYQDSRAHSVGTIAPASAQTYRAPAYSAPAPTAAPSIAAAPVFGPQYAQQFSPQFAPQGPAQQYGAPQFSGPQFAPQQFGVPQYGAPQGFPGMFADPFGVGFGMSLNGYAPAEPNYAPAEPNRLSGAAPAEPAMAPAASAVAPVYESVTAPAPIFDVAPAASVETVYESVDLGAQSLGTQPTVSQPGGYDFSYDGPAETPAFVGSTAQIAPATSAQVDPYAAARALEQQYAAPAPAPYYEAAPAPTQVAFGAPALGSPDGMIQVGAFKSPARAERLADKLIGAGQPAFVVPAVVRGQQWFRVRVGTPSKADARFALEQIRALGFYEARLVRG